MKKRIALAALIAASVAATPAATVNAQSPNSGAVQPVSFVDMMEPVSCEPYPMGCDADSASDLSRHGSGIFSRQFVDQDCESDGEPFSLFGEVMGYTIGGWTQLGYHSQNLPLFNSRKYDYQLHQQWFYAEKVADGSGGFDIGGRMDYLYGTDGPDTQAFGIDNDHWDNDFDHGPDYGHAIPQLYTEVAYGDLSAKVGHFYTIIGYEVVAATGNFFYSHAYTMYNSEPFTHTGALLTYKMTDDITYYGGYTLGWDSGFEDNGDAFLGGASIDLTDDLNVTSNVVGGRFADNQDANERGFMSSTVAQLQLTEPLSYVLQVDILDTEDAAGNTVRETFDINQYLFRTISDRLAIGARMEWWNVDGESSGFRGDNANQNFQFAGDDYDVYALTLGANVRPHSNLVIRPEIRWDWVYGDDQLLRAADLALDDSTGPTFLDSGQSQQVTFGIDTVIQF